MGLLDIFKSKWSAGKMTEGDRKKLFWYLKRKASHTAWKREADAFDSFAGVFEKQVREEPIAKAGPYSYEDMNWEELYPEILKCQVLYEKALAQLKQGDRSVWLYNERGLMDDASTISGHWYTELVNHGQQGDHFPDGKYVEEMTAAIKEYSLAARDTAGVLQPMMADTSAPYFWGESMECILNNELYPKEFDPAFFVTPHKLASYIQYPDPLPEVPVADSEILIPTGQNTPVFGIYEPQVKDGCMNYLLQDVPAPFGRDLSGDNKRVTWKLIWEDTRYLDSEIPAEEHLYFPPEPNSAQVQQDAPVNDLLSAATGQPCPKEGRWSVMDDLQGTLELHQGERMPKHNGRDVTWVWVE
ncbi:MAG: hypothetical protein HHJ16_09575 [Polaromonas sp.]|uniref:Imm71 family immunity protein n=1 Tax=Polaromonas sp. TaxID=1869339 RepID=UPI00180822CC|nr:Imm71 family immunity protein [Polaromonas sp.]NMM10511.1 hypothetical protein [Polaromonas sp.]